jgi:hypothetical protein
MVKTDAYRDDTADTWDQEGGATTALADKLTPA